MDQDGRTTEHLAGRTFSALVADDNPAVRGLVGTALRLSSHCHRVHFARSGREAVEVWEREAPDVILMDLRMPDMDGAAAVRRIRPQDPTVCIVVMSASQVGEMDVELAGLPVDAVIEKGMEPGDLGGFLARLCEDKHFHGKRGIPRTDRPRHGAGTHGGAADGQTERNT